MTEDRVREIAERAAACRSHHVRFMTCQECIDAAIREAVDEERKALREKLFLAACREADELCKALDAREKGADR